MTRLFSVIMCGISGIFGNGWSQPQLEAMVKAQRHRGPNTEGIFISKTGLAGLGHNRLSIIDLSTDGDQPMSDPEGRYWVIFNGEIYNYLELRKCLKDEYPFKSRSDTEVLLAAYRKWGSACLDKLVGMFAFAVWDETDRALFVARDRFGVKPLYYHRRPDGTLFLASEIKALRAAGISSVPDEVTWANYHVYGLYDHSERTFWKDILSLPPGHTLTNKAGHTQVSCWYDLAERVGAETDERPVEAVCEEYLDLLVQSVRLRFRSDVPVGVNLSGGVDSSTLLSLVQQVQGCDSNVKAFTFITGDPRYDELPWVNRMLASTKHPSVVCQLRPEEVPSLAHSVQAFQEEPFGGLPTLSYARLFERAREEGVTVLLDGNGLDEQWAGYDYYASLNGQAPSLVQGIRTPLTRPECLTPEFRALAEPFTMPQSFTDPLRNTQYRDLRFTKIPRALRFNDRISMRASTELREPFLDHRLVELALRQPPERKIAEGKGKWLLRRIARKMMPTGLVDAPKRLLQTPQREWLRGPLLKWAQACIEDALAGYGDQWLDPVKVREVWGRFQQGGDDNSFYLWQWITVGLFTRFK